LWRDLTGRLLKKHSGGDKIANPESDRVDFLCFSGLRIAASFALQLWQAD